MSEQERGDTFFTEMQMRRCTALTMDLCGFDPDRTTVNDKASGVREANAGLFLLLSSDQFGPEMQSKLAVSTYLELHEGIGHPILVELDLDIAFAVDLHSF